jgi:hypothetical protein
MDLLFMKNLVEDMNKSGLKAAKNLKLEMFNKVYDDTSLFHYFADDFEVLDWFSNQWKKETENQSLSLIARRMPLLALNPDKKGMTAVDWSLFK